MNMKELQKELDHQKQILQLLRDAADPAVKGSLCRRVNKNGTIRYYHACSDQVTGKKTYRRITGKDKELYRILMANSELSDWKGRLEKNIDLLQQIIENFCPVCLSEFMEVIPRENTFDNSAFIERPPASPSSMFDWDALKASAGTFRPEGLLYEADGLRFRSKGEAMHAMCFANAEIEYIYEPEIRLGSLVLHPDFAVRNKRTGKIYFWEYFGMLDVKEYRDSFCRKLPALMELGIIPGYNLICTCEFKGICELSVEEIQAKIRAYLL